MRSECAAASRSLYLIALANLCFEILSPTPINWLLQIANSPCLHSMIINHEDELNQVIILWRVGPSQLTFFLLESLLQSS